MESERDRFIRSCNQTRKDKDRKIKSENMLDWPVTKSVKNIQKFLGLANYYRRFVKEFAKIVRLLHKLTKKE